MTHLSADEGQISMFFSALFKYADEETYVSFRAFDQFDRKAGAFFIEPAQIGSDETRIVQHATALANRAANNHSPIVFAPPVATFANPRSASSADVANGIAISVEIDQANPVEGRRKLEHLLGPVTIAVLSGGDWIDPATGEIHPKAHLHWRLSEPTRTPEDHTRLREARYLAALLIGADTTAAPPAHPLRWPGSWNRKAKTPRLAQIAAGNEASEVHLDDVLEKLQLAVEAAGLGQDTTPRTSGDPQSSLALVSSALRYINNQDVHWEEWNRIGMAVWRATAGSLDGLTSWSDWSAQSKKHDESMCSSRWSHFASSPPSRIGAGTIFFIASNNGWERPQAKRPEAEAPADMPPEYWKVLDEEIAAPIKPGEDDSKFIIRVIAGQIDKLATKAEDTLIASGLPVFQRGGGSGGTLVRPACWEVPASDSRVTLAAGLMSIKSSSMIDLLAQSATWLKFDGRSKSWVETNPPPAIADVVLSRVGFWRLPIIAGVITTPTIRRDGSLLTDHGYDKTTRLFHMKDEQLVIPPISERPSQADAMASLGLLQDLLTNFPFITGVDQAVALSGLISPVVRGALGMVPLHAFTAPTPGSGKSFVVDLVSAIATGRVCPVATAGKSEEETEKRLGGLLLAGFPVVSIDNMSSAISGDLLCQMVERPIIRIRALGKSDIIEIESRAVPFATGNNLIVADDMTRRVLLGRLDAGVERPEERIFDFDPVEDILRDRGKYIAACLTIVMAYLAAGKPGKLSPIASFVGWSNAVRSALVWLGCADPAESIKEARESDPILNALRSILETWNDCFFKPVTLRQVASAISSFSMDSEDGEKLLALRTAIASVASDRGQIDQAKLGYWLRKSKGRIVNGKRFNTTGLSDGLARWTVETIE